MWLQIVIYVCVALYLLTVASVIFNVILENRNPVRTLAWIIVLVTIPLLGFLFYLYFGVNYRKIKMFSRKGARDLGLRKELCKEMLEKFEDRENIPQEVRRHHKLVVQNIRSAYSLLSANDSVQIYFSGKEALSAMLEAMRGARTHIHLQSFIIEDDRVGNAFKEVLMAKAREGVEVRMMYDGFGGRRLGKKFLGELQEAGVEIPFFHAGGDEVPKNPWTGSPDVQELMRGKGFKDTHDVHEYFVVRMADIISSKGIKVGGWQESAMGHDEATDRLLRDKFAGINSWNTIPDWGDDSIPYSIANNGYKVILSNVGNFYLDMAYNANPEEPGLSWGGYVDEYRSWEGRPYDIYHSTSLTLDGKPLGEDVAEGKPVLTDEGKKNIIGVQAQMFGETIRNFGMVELYMFPKIFGVVERAWNATVDDEKMELIRYNRLIGTSELPYLQRCGINFHLGMPGIRRSDDMVFMNSPYPEAEIRYTTDGKEPDSGSKLWKGPVKESAKVIKAKLFYLGKESKTVELR